MVFHPDFMMQTLGAIVQLYTSILAIGGAFYIFVIERMRQEYRASERQVWNAVRDLDEKALGRLVDNFRYRAMNEGIDWLDSTLEELEVLRRIDKADKFRNYPEYKVYRDNFPEYKRLKKRQGTWSYEKFKDLFSVSTAMLIMSIILMFIISSSNFSDYYGLAFVGVVLASIVGFIFLVYSITTIRKLDTLDYVWEVS